MPKQLDVSRFLENVTGHYARFHADLIQRMVIALARGNEAQMEDLRKAFSKLTIETMGVAEVLGATMVLQDTAKHIGIEKLGTADQFHDADDYVAFANAPTQAILPRVTFHEAGEDMVARAPVTIKDAAQRTWQRIAQLYSEDHVAGFVRSAEDAVTERVQKLIAKAIDEGITEAETGKLIKMSVDEIRTETKAWTESYARMVFRTNLNTAVTAGQFKQAQDPDILAVVPAKQFDAVGDNDTRPNHQAADGLIFKVTNRIWNEIAPPLGYGCRCRVRSVSVPELRRMGRLDENGDVKESPGIPKGAYPDQGFRSGRVDLFS